jgi:hypothetical protein
MTRRTGQALIVASIVGAAAAALLYRINDYGPGVWPDSMGYMQFAQWFLGRREMVTFAGGPVVDLPPAYPMLLAASNVFVPDIVQAARWLHAVLFGLNTVLFGSLVYWSTGRRAAPALGAMLLFLSSAQLLSLHSMAMSEAPFLTFLLGGLLLLAMDLARPRPLTLIAASLVLGLALATRLAGVTVLAPVLAGTLFWRGRGTRRYRDSLVAAVLVCAPFAVWYVKTALFAGGTSGRAFAVHPITLTQLAAAVFTVHDFFFPLAVSGRVKAAVLLTLLGSAGAALVIDARAVGQRPEPMPVESTVPRLGLVFAAAYVLLVLVSVSFFDANIGLDSRILSPLCVVVAAAVFPLAYSAARNLRRPAIGWAAASLLLLSIALNLPRARAWAIETHRDGLYYTSRAWQTSESIAFVRAVPADVPIYTNDPYVIEFLASRRVARVPWARLQFTGKPNPDYQNQLRSMCRDIQERAAILVWLENAGPWFRETLEDYEAGCTPRVTRRLADGTVHGARFNARSGLVAPP